MSWQEASRKYTEEVMPDAVKPSTQKRYKVSFRAVDPWLRGKFLSNITRETLNTMVDERRKALVSNATINRDLTAISQVLACGIEWGACKENAAANFNRKLLTRERRDPITLPSDKAVKAVILRAPGNFSKLISFYEQTGCRQEEGAALQWSNVRLEKRQATFIGTKTSPARTIDLTEETVDLLKGIKRKGPYVFHHDGERYHNVASRFAQLCAAAGQDFRCHDLRHRFAVRYLQKKGGEAIYDLQKQLGHSSIKTTEIYLAYTSEKSHQSPESVAVSGDTDGDE
jgi:integrase